MASKTKPVTLADLKREAPKGWVISQFGSAVKYVSAGPERGRGAFIIMSFGTQTARRACRAALREMKEKP